MSIGTTTRRRFGGRIPRSSTVLAAVMAAGLTLSGGAALAQSATPGASPAASPVASAVSCQAPQVPAGTPAAMAEAPGMEMGTPAATPMASPVAAPTAPTGTDVTDQASIDRVEGAVRNLYACFDSGNYTGTAALMTDAYRQAQFGTTNLYTVAAQLEQLGAFAKFSNEQFHGVQQLSGGNYAVDYQVTFGKQVFHYVWVLVPADKYLMVDQEYELTPTTDQDMATVGVQAATDSSEYAYDVSPSEIAALPAIMIHGTNAGKMEHEIIMFQVPDGYDAKNIANLDPTKMSSEGISFVGQLFLPVGEQGDMLLEGLTPGTYVIACFIQAPDGQSHAAKGMIATITVTPPATVEVPNVVASPAASPVATPAS